LIIHPIRRLATRLGLIPLALFSTVAFAAGTDRVLVVRNGNSPISLAVANDYALRRSIRNVVTIRCPDAAIDPLFETIDFASYQAAIEKPLRAFLSAHPAIDFIVLTKGIPIRLRGAAHGDGVEWFSLDSRLAALDYQTRQGAIRVDIEDPDYRAGYIASFHRTFHAHAWANRFWNSTQPFSHAKFGGYLVTRLDGYTQADAEALTTKSLEAEQTARKGTKPSGEILLNVAPSFGFTDKARQPYSILPANPVAGMAAKITSEKAHLGDFNSDLQAAADALKARGFPVELEEAARFVGNRSGLMGYMSWGSNDPKFDAAAYHSLTFAPGALVDTAVSTSGRTFLPTQGGQSLVADLIAQGVTGIKGYTDEPLVQAIASPSILFDRYTRGWTLAESFYAASALVGWEDIVIGDPLARAYTVIKIRPASPLASNVNPSLISSSLIR
jgi:uncharacterized protein (TIGR03790 family)